MIGIYKIENSINGKVYVGSSFNILKRWESHRRSLLKNEHHSVKLQRAYRKHGLDIFKFEIIEESSKQELIEKEQYYIDSFNSFNKGYNCSPIAGNCSGREVSKKTREKMRISATGRKMSASAIEKMKNKIVSEETRKKMSQSRKGLNTWRKNKKHSDLTIQKMKISKSGKNNPNYISTPIIQYDINWILVKQWDDLLSLRQAGFNSKNISAVCRGKRKTACGFFWKFKI